MNSFSKQYLLMALEARIGTRQDKPGAYLSGDLQSKGPSMCDNPSIILNLLDAMNRHWLKKLLLDPLGKLNTSRQKPFLYVLRLLILLFLFLGMFFDAAAQSRGRVAYSIYKEGLSQLQITRMCEDRQGRIWVGTKDGICIFNPATRTFENPSNNPMLRTGVIHDVQVDRRGKVWYVNNHGVYSEEGDSLLLPRTNGWISSMRIEFDRWNRPWFLWLSRNEAFVWINEMLVPVTTLYPSLTGCQLKEIGFHAKSGSIVLTTHDNSLILLAAGIGHPSWLPSNDSCKYLLSKDNQLFRFTSTSTQELGGDLGLLPSPNRQLMNLNGIDRLGIDRYGQKYFTRESNIYQLTENGAVDLGTRFRIPTDLLCSTNGAIYLGTEEGLVVFHSPRFYFWDSRDGVDYPWSVVVDDQGVVWYGGYQSGLHQLDSLNNMFVADSSCLGAFSTEERNRGWHDDFYMGSKIGNQGQLLLSTGAGVISKHGSICQFLNDPQNCGRDAVFDILEDPFHQRIFAACQNIWEIGPKGTCNVIDKGREAYSQQYFLDLEITPGGQIWAGGTNQLFVLKEDSLVEHSYGGGGSALHFDGNRLLWAAGKNAAGLWAIDPKTRRAMEIGRNIFSRYVSAIEHLDSSYLYFGGIDGLHVLRLDEFYRTGRVFHAKYDHHNGLVGRECGQNGMFKDRNGVLYFVTEDALMKLDGNLFKQALGYPYDTTEVKFVSGKEITTGSKLVPLNSAVPAFRFDHNNFRFEFHCADQGPFLLRFQLNRMEDPLKIFQGGVSADGTIELRNLPKGRYRLLVIPDLNGRKLLLAKEFWWEFQVYGPWDFWGWFLGFGILLLLLLGFASAVILRQRNRVRLLLGELHHRVLNNLSIVRRLIAVAASLGNFDQQRLTSQINAFIEVHDQLQLNSGSASVDLKNYFLHLGDRLQNTFFLDDSILTFGFDGAQGPMLNVDSRPLRTTYAPVYQCNVNKIVV